MCFLLGSIQRLAPRYRAGREREIRFAADLRNRRSIRIGDVSMTRSQHFSTEVSEQILDQRRTAADHDYRQRPAASLVILEQSAQTIAQMIINPLYDVGADVRDTHAFSEVDTSRCCRNISKRERVSSENERSLGEAEPNAPWTHTAVGWID